MRRQCGQLAAHRRAFVAKLDRHDFPNALAGSDPQTRTPGGDGPGHTLGGGAPDKVGSAAIVDGDAVLLVLDPDRWMRWQGIGEKRLHVEYGAERRLHNRASFPTVESQ